MSHVTRYSCKSLRILGSVGEPINPSAWRWFYNVVGDSRCPISDTWWQTETGGFMITPLPGAWPQKPGSATFPFLEFSLSLLMRRVLSLKAGAVDIYVSSTLGLQPFVPYTVIMKDMRQHTSSHSQVITSAVMAVGETKMVTTGSPEEWTMSSMSVVTVLVPAEVESALVSHIHSVPRLLWLVLSMRLKGRVSMHLLPWSRAFLTVKNFVSLIQCVRQQIGAFADPDKIHWASGLPKTRSGKIMRRILRKIASRQLDELGDTGTLAEPGVVAQLIALADK